MTSMKLLCVTFVTASVIAVSSCQSNWTTSNSGPEKDSLRGTPDTGNASAKNSNSTALNSNTATVDSFWKEAASGGMAEVELGKVAQTKAQSAEVKRFAQMMVTDHTRSNEELKALAARKNVPLPTAMDPRHQATMQQLQNLTGVEFDRAYVDAMVKDHEATVQLFESQTQGASTDADVKAFAEKTLPTLRKHLETIRSIQSNLK